MILQRDLQSCINRARGGREVAPTPRLADYMTEKILAAVVVLLATAAPVAQDTSSNARPRASDLGLRVGILPTGPLDAITDVAGVEVGQTTITRGDECALA